MRVVKRLNIGIAHGKELILSLATIYCCHGWASTCHFGMYRIIVQLTHKCADSQELSLLAYTKYGRRSRARSNCAIDILLSHDILVFIALSNS